MRGVLGFSLIIVFFILMITAFALIEPFKEALDNNRNTSSLNCPGTTGFNQTLYDEDNDFVRLVKRPTCFVTGISMVWYIMSFLIAAATWVVSQWGKIR